MTVDDLVQQVRSWAAGGEAIVAELHAERSKLVDRILVIDSTLRMMGTKSPGAAAALAKRGPRPGRGGKTLCLLDYLTANPGAFAVDVRTACGLSRGMLHYTMAKGLVRYEGSKQHARWYVVEGRNG